MTLLSTLYVDLDGTFIKSDMLLESCLAAIKEKPYLIFMLLVWLTKGRSYLKAKLAEHSSFNVTTIPLNRQTSAFITDQKGKGRRIILATASNEDIAQKFVDAYPIFDGFLASTPIHNLKGACKLEEILKVSADFSYMGNSSEDFVLFEKAQESYLVNPTKAAVKLNNGDFVIKKVLDYDPSLPKFKVWFKQLRIHQWIKNVLIFVPILISNQFTDLALLTSTIIGFICFGMLASSTYILNDLVDLESDREHPRKCKRPLACCELSILDGTYVASILFVVAMLGALAISIDFFLVLLMYLVLTVSYSLKLKRYFAMDVIALASLYTIRIFAGAAILGVTVSFWLLSFSMFIFLSLALVKRCAELVALQSTEKENVSGRDYNVGDLTVFTSFGVTASMLAILMYCFYMNSDILSNQYQEPELLWLSLPAFGYWLMRMWVKTIRGEMHDDPIVYSLRDKGSLVSISIMLAVTILAHVL
jgi:4-hydroxybenzoate polyprenyltransferase